MAIKPVLVKGGKFFWVNMGREGTSQTAGSPGAMTALGMDLVPDALYPAQLFKPVSVQQEKKYSRLTNIKFHLHQSLAQNVSLHLMSSLLPGSNNGKDCFDCKTITAVYICDMTLPIHRCLKFMKLLHTSKCGIQVFYAFSLQLFIQESQTDVQYDCENHVIRTFAVSTTAFDESHQDDIQLNNSNLNRTQCVPEPAIIPRPFNPMLASEKVKSVHNYTSSNVTSTYDKRSRKYDTSLPLSPPLGSNITGYHSNDNFIIQMRTATEGELPSGNSKKSHGKGMDSLERLESNFGRVSSSITSNRKDISGSGPVIGTEANVISDTETDTASEVGEIGFMPQDEEYIRYHKRAAQELSEENEQTDLADIRAYVKVESYEEKVISSTDTASEVGETVVMQQDKQNLMYDYMAAEEKEIHDLVSEDQVSDSPPYEPDFSDSTDEEEEVLLKERPGGLPQRRAARVATKRVRKKSKTIFGEDVTTTDAAKIRTKQARHGDRDYNPYGNSDSSIISYSSGESDEDFELKKVKRVKAERGRCSKCYYVHEQPMHENLCFICNPPHVIANPDPPLKRHSEEESLPDLPKGLKYVSSDVDGNLKTLVVTNKLIRKGTQFGPVVGCTLPYEELDCTACNEEYYWPYFDLESRTATVVDTSDLTRSNWFHFVRGSNTNGNMFQVYKEDTIYLVACNDIAPDQELTIMPYSKIFRHNERAFQVSHDESLLHLSCDRCKIEYNCRLDLCRHLLVFHTKNFRFKTVNCATCGLLICTRKQAREHRQEFGCKVYKCDICGKKVTTIISLGQHRRAQHAALCLDTYLCDQCGKPFPTKIRVNAHKRKVHDRPKFHCPECPKVFRSGPALRRHLNYHTKTYSFTCDRCGKPFVDKTNLDVHMLTHSGRKPFKCTECSCGFTTKQSLQSHYKKKHGYTMESMPEIKRLFPLRENDKDEGEMG